MKHLLKKLRASAGESLVETLAAILIVALSSVTLLGAAMGASQINRLAQAADERFSAELGAAESQSGAPTGAGEITLKPKDITDPGTYTFDVSYYGGSGALVSYRLTS